MSDLSNRLELLRQLAFFQAGGGKRTGLQDFSDLLTGLGQGTQSAGQGFQSGGEAILAATKAEQESRPYSEYVLPKSKDEVAKKLFEQQTATRSQAIKNNLQKLFQERGFGSEKPTPSEIGIASENVPQVQPYISREQQLSALQEETPFNINMPLSAAKTYADTQEALAKAQSYLSKEEKSPMKVGIHRIVDKRTGKVLQEIPSTAGTGDTFTLVGSDTTESKAVLAENKATSAIKKKLEGEIADARSIGKTSIAELNRILPLNDESSGGVIGGLRQKGMSAINIEDEKFRNTADVINSARSMVAKVLKSTFGGQLSDGEREYLNSVYGAMPNLSIAERRIALTNVKRMFENKIQEKENKYLEITGEGFKSKGSKEEISTPKTVRVFNPQGKEVNIEIDQLNDALKQGYRTK